MEDIKAIKKRIFNIIQIGNRTDFASTLFDWILVIAIITNITVIFLETFDEMRPYFNTLELLDTITISLFIVEYILRIWTSEYLYPELSRKEAVKRFLFSYDGIVDLLTILPFFFLSGFVAFRMIRIVRILRLFKINSNYDSFKVIKEVLLEKKNQILSSLFILFILMLASSLCMYSAEHDAQPEVFKNAFSGIWWSMSALLTVGYGDIYPITTLGRIMAIIISVLGVMVVAIPTGIVSAGFVENYTRAQNGGLISNTELEAITIGKDSSWLNKNLEQIKKESGYTIIMVKRDGMTLVPNQEYLVQLGDEVVIFGD